MPAGSGAGRGAGGHFATTQWSLVLAAADRGSAGAEEALARLCSRYWHPVFAFVRRQGHTADEARDLTQGFFARLIEKGVLRDADRQRGRFRSFVLTACRFFLANQRDRAVAQKRGGGRVPISIDLAESRYQQALAHGETPERLYDRQWCLTLLDGVLEAVRAAYAADGREEVFDRLEPFLTEAPEAGTHAEAARDLGTSAGAVKVAVHRLRRRYREELCRRVADTVDSDQDVEDELRYLLKTLGPTRHGG